MSDKVYDREEMTRNGAELVVECMSVVADRDGAMAALDFAFGCIQGALRVMAAGIKNGLDKRAVLESQLARALAATLTNEVAKKPETLH